MSVCYKVPVEIELRDIVFISAGDIAESIIRTYSELDKKNRSRIIPSYFPHNNFGALLELIRQLAMEIKCNSERKQKLQIYNTVPLRIKIDRHRSVIIPIIPGSTIKGILRYSYDFYNIINILKSIDSKDFKEKIEKIIKILLSYYESIEYLLDYIINFLGNLFNIDFEDISDFIYDLIIEDSKLFEILGHSKAIAILLLSYILALQSNKSCLTFLDILSCSLPLNATLFQLRNLLEKKVDKQYKFTLCEGCLVFGCRGYESPLKFEDAEPLLDKTDTDLVVRTFNQLCQPERKTGTYAKTAPYDLMGFKEGLRFRSKIIIKYSHTYNIGEKIASCEHAKKYKDLIEDVLQRSAEIASGRVYECIITMGRRGTAGYGRMNITVHIEK